jgi:hypothetical protein
LLNIKLYSLLFNKIIDNYDIIIDGVDNNNNKNDNNNNDKNNNKPKYKYTKLLIDNPLITEILYLE